MLIGGGRESFAAQHNEGVSGAPSEAELLHDKSCLGVMDGTRVLEIIPLENEEMSKQAAMKEETLLLHAGFYGEFPINETAVEAASNVIYYEVREDRLRFLR
jgi:hypothetical protein